MRIRAELTGKADQQVFDAALRQITTYTHIAFSSRNGVHAVLDGLHRLYGDAAADVVRGAGVRLCALGADAEVVRAAGYEVAVQPREASTQGLVRELALRGECDGANILCPVPLVSGALSHS